MKEKKQQQDLESLRQDHFQQQQQGYQSPSQQAPMDQFKQHIASLEQNLRQQQLETETTLQNSFSQATSGLGDAQSINQLMQVCKEVTNLIQNQGMQGSSGQYAQLLNELENNLQQQMQSGNQQVVQGLQQSVTALAQANAALLDGQNYHQMLGFINQAKLLLANWEAGQDTQLH